MQKVQSISKAVSMQLDGKNILVTGAAKRVGREIALELARRGASIAVHYRSSEKEALQAVDEIRKLGVEAEAIGGELSSWNEAQKTVFVAAEELGGLDCLVNNASTFYKTPIEKIGEKNYRELLDSNLSSAFACSLAAAKIFSKNASGGKIVSIADWSPFKPYKDYAAYQIAKAGVVAMTAVLAKELAPKILVNAVAPGPTLPPKGMDGKEIEAIAEATLLKKWGGGHSIAHAVAFLLENDFITGQTIVVDGGRMLK